MHVNRLRNSRIILPKKMTLWTVCFRIRGGSFVRLLELRWSEALGNSKSYLVMSLEHGGSMNWSYPNWL